MDIQTVIETIQQNPLLLKGIKILAIIIVALLINRFGRIFIDKLIRQLVKQQGDGLKIKQRKKRANTLISVLGGTLEFVIGVTALLMVLSSFGVEIGPLLAGAGLIGLAIGMASKEIIIDFLSGLFIILEDQYHIGDNVKIAGVEGKVKEITLRRTIVKDSSGMVHSIPNGQIKIIARKN